MNEVLKDKKQQIKKRENVKSNENICPICSDVLNNMFVCGKCGYHSHMPYKNRIEMIADKGTFRQIYKNDIKDYSLKYNYKEKYNKSKNKTKLDEAIISGKCKIEGKDVVVCIMEYEFMAGTLSLSNGEKICKTIEYATKKKFPLIIFCASGGARVQEGIPALVQMPKIVSALNEHKKRNLLYISVLTNPTLGGVSASFALAGDINISEPNTTIGFAGKKVIAQTLQEELDEKFQTESFNICHGSIDMVVKRKELKATLSNIVNILDKENKPIDVKNIAVKHDRKTYSYKEILKHNRDIKTNKSKDYILKITQDFYELHGDRISKDDQAIIAGIGKINGIKVAIIAQNKGRNLTENIQTNYGMTSPQGYRKGIRIAKLAQKFNLPLIILIDSAGAYPGKSGEENGQAIAIYESMSKFLDTSSIVLTYIIGEACSGGAVALSVSDYLAMFSKAMYCVISPEAYMKILNNCNQVDEKVLSEMKYSAKDLYEENIVDEVLEERDFEYNALQLVNSITQQVEKLSHYTKEELVKNRYKRIRNIDNDIRS